MKLIFASVVLCLLVSSLAQYQINSWVTGGCSGSAARDWFKTGSCLQTASGQYTMYTCDGTTATSKTCTDAACSVSCSTVSAEANKCIDVLGVVSSQITCPSSPPSGSVVVNQYPLADCKGTPWTRVYDSTCYQATRTSKRFQCTSSTSMNSNVYNTANDCTGTACTAISVSTKTCINNGPSSLTSSSYNLVQCGSHTAKLSIFLVVMSFILTFVVAL
jgi:hypothetical protein